MVCELKSKEGKHSRNSHFPFEEWMLLSLCLDVQLRLLAKPLIGAKGQKKTNNPRWQLQLKPLPFCMPNACTNRGGSGHMFVTATLFFSIPPVDLFICSIIHEWWEENWDASLKVTPEVTQRDGFQSQLFLLQSLRELNTIFPLRFLPSIAFPGMSSCIFQLQVLQ